MSSSTSKVGSRAPPVRPGADRRGYPTVHARRSLAPERDDRALIVGCARLGNKLFCGIVGRDIEAYARRNLPTACLRSANPPYPYPRFSSLKIRTWRASDGRRTARTHRTTTATTPALIRPALSRIPPVTCAVSIASVQMSSRPACTAVTAYLLAISSTSLCAQEFPQFVLLGGVCIAIFMVRGAALYGQAVLLSRIANRISAANQRRMFDKLLNESLSYYVDRHSSEFTARLNTGAIAASTVLNLLLLAVGRDFFTLVGLVIVMFVQDPLLSLITLIVFPPAMLLLRKMARRIRHISRVQFTGGTRILETLQEALQGLRIVKAFTLEQALRARFDRNVAEVEHEANKWARVANRTSPLMETLGGFAIAAAIVYGGYRVIQWGTTPGEFFSFIAAFLLANEPAKRLARPTSSSTATRRRARAVEIIDSPPSEPADDHSRRSGHGRAQSRSTRCASPIGRMSRCAACRSSRSRGRSRRWSAPRAAASRRSSISSCDSTRRTAARSSSTGRTLRRCVAALAGQQIPMWGRTRSCSAARSATTSASQLGADEAAIVGRQSRACPRLHHGLPVQLRHAGRRARVAAFGRARQRVAIARALIKNAPIILLDEATAALVPSPSTTCRPRSPNCARAARPWSSRIGSRPSCTRTASSWSRTAS